MLPSVEDVHPYLAPIALIQSFYPLVNATALGRGRIPTILRACAR